MSPPTLVYDDDCGVCTRAARFVDRRAAINIVGFSELSDDLRTRLPPDYEECAHFVTDETTYSCGAAMERAYERTGLLPSQLFPLVRRVPGYVPVREFVYRVVASNRPSIGRLLP
ncbi:thiol-disulfide oxidoreductase DCC family protein [Halopiger xanaduensis]|uniref:Thiol-disulfide oxidoreductase DCC n=1 Tax=Halopiger xanaduensis (strain DSM 18323 / JCM 14033 / SH-6) TaxID=797210 RepID=F8DEE4_HALXS|nr:DUF393 domain-containing protein [Halopiger xanaduensis]AEH39434.1 thiol-disulfide oxidoreductase DCC [Halopiger xanaduensis SH-6]